MEGPGRRGDGEGKAKGKNEAEFSNLRESDISGGGH